MKISPITNNRINNISHKAKLTDVAERLLTVQSSMYKNSLYGKEAKPAEIDKEFLVSFILDKSCRDLFKWKSKSQISNIRNKYKVMAEENYEKLTKMLGELFPDNCYFDFTKQEDKKFHAVMRSASNWYEHDFGPMNFSEKNNSFSDIESVRELVERIMNLSKEEIAKINYKLKEKPIEPPPDKPIDVSGAVSFIIITA